MWEIWGCSQFPQTSPKLSLEPSLLIFPDGFSKAFPHRILSLFRVTEFLHSHHQPFNHLIASPASGESLYSNHRSHGTSLLHPALNPRTLRAPEESFDFSLRHLSLLLHVGNADVLFLEMCQPIVLWGSWNASPKIARSALESTEPHMVYDCSSCNCCTQKSCLLVVLPEDFAPNN